MSNAIRVTARFAVVSCALLLAACRPPLQVDTIQVGRTLNSDHSISEHTTSFQPDDAVHAAVLTGATGSSTIGVRWMYGGRAVLEESKDVSYKGQAATDFLFRHNGNLPSGEYTVEILVDGQPAGNRKFRVER